MLLRTRAVCALSLAALAALAVSLLPNTRADEVVTKDGKKLEGRITTETPEAIEILTYKDGPVRLEADKVKSTKKKPNLWDDFDKKWETTDNTAEGHFGLAEWCKQKGLTYRAQQEYALTVAMDRTHEKAHKALGHELFQGEWMTHDEVMRAKGFELKDGKWVEAKKLKEERAAHRVGLVLTAACHKDLEPDKAFLEEFGDRAKEFSKLLYRLTQGQMYVKEFTIYPHAEGKPCDYTIENKDSDRLTPTVFAETVGGTIRSPGKMTPYTFIHELLHLKYDRPHCENCKNCCVTNDPGYKKHPEICDDDDHVAPPTKSCWAAIRAYHSTKGIELKPLDHKKDVEIPDACPETNLVIKMDK